MLSTLGMSKVALPFYGTLGFVSTPESLSVSRTNLECARPIGIPDSQN
jgi:hypothetical protein